MRLAHPWLYRASLWFQRRITQCLKEFLQVLGANTYLLLGVHPGLWGTVPSMRGGVGWLPSAAQDQQEMQTTGKEREPLPGLRTCPSQGHCALILSAFQLQ